MSTRKRSSWLAKLPKFERLIKATLTLDIGSRYTRVVYQNKLVWHQPSCVTFHTGSQTVIEIGQKAWQAVGKTPASVQVLFPIHAGKISDIPVAVQYVRALLQTVLTQVEVPFVLQLQATVGVGSSLSPVEVRTWTNILHEAGFQSVKLMTKSQALLAHQTTTRPTSWWLELGDQSSEMGIFVDQQLVKSWSWNFGGHHYTQELQDLLRSQYLATISQATAESIKMQQRALDLRLDQSQSKNAKTTLRASDAVTHEPKIIYLERRQVEDRFATVSQELIHAIHSRLAEVSPDIVRTVLETGLTMAGGTAQLSGLKEYLAAELHTEVQVTAQPELEVIWALAAAQTER